MAEEYEKGAKFNSGIDKLYRIGTLRRACHNCKMENNYRVWFASLQGIRSEINAKMTKDSEREEASERNIANHYEFIIKCFLDNNMSVKIKHKGKDILIKNLDIYSVLYDYELWLGDIEEKYKFGMPDVDEEGL